MDAESPHSCQLYLITPPRIAGGSFAEELARLLDSVPVAAVRLQLESRDASDIARAADALRTVCHARDVPLLLAEHYRMVRNLGLDGVHLMGTRDIRAAREELGAKPSIGAYCGTSRHAGLTAGEIGADYVTFGPVNQTDLGSGETVTMDDFEWWHQMIEVPSVAEGEMTPEIAATLAKFADFIALGPEVWSAEGNPLSVLQTFDGAIAL